MTAMGPSVGNPSMMMTSPSNTIPPLYPTFSILRRTNSTLRNHTHIGNGPLTNNYGTILMRLQERSPGSDRWLEVCFSYGFNDFNEALKKLKYSSWDTILVITKLNTPRRLPCMSNKKKTN